MMQYMNFDVIGDFFVWFSFIWIVFGISFMLMIIGIYYLLVDWWIKGYLYMGILFLIVSMLILSKSLCDWYEYEWLVNWVKNV